MRTKEEVETMVDEVRVEFDDLLAKCVAYPKWVREVLLRVSQQILR